VADTPSTRERAKQHGASNRPLIWVFLSSHAGDNAQALALAEELALPFEAKRLRFTWRKRLPSGRPHRVSLISLDRTSREEQIVPPWPDLIILVGSRGQPVARWVQRQNDNQTRLVLIGDLRAPSSAFDLVLTTAQYRVPEGANVRLLPVAMSRYRSRVLPSDEERDWLRSLPRPHLLLMIGGPTRYWAVTPHHVANLVASLHGRARRLGGSVILAPSSRTPKQVLARMEDEAASRSNCRVAAPAQRFQVLLENADELFPTADSISMISESIVAGKPAGIAFVPPTLLARIVFAIESLLPRQRKRDLRRFWNYVREQHLIGTIEEPIAAAIANPAIAAASEVRKLIQDQH
jgi:mitochondrial fission protein ELM1